MKINELAQYINLPVDTLERWIRQGKIPIYKIGEECVFNEGALTKWADVHGISFHGNTAKRGKDKKGVKTEKNDNPLVDAMQQGGVLYNVSGDDVASVIRTAVDGVAFLSPGDKDVLSGELMARESLMSTGIGNGVAIPHPRNPLSGMIDDAKIITGFLSSSVDFHAVDGKPVFVMFIILSPATKTHLFLLSQLTYLLRDNSFIEMLKKAPEKELFFKEIEGRVKKPGLKR